MASLDPSFDTMNVAALKAECDTRGLPSTGRKADLVARLQAATSSSASTAAPPAAGLANSVDPNGMKVPELKAELAALGEPAAGNKAALVSRLIAARAGVLKRPAPAPATTSTAPSAKKAKKARCRTRPCCPL